VLERGLAAAIGNGDVQLFVGAERGERHVVDRPRDAGAVDHVDGERARVLLRAARERLGDRHMGARRARHAERGFDRRTVDDERILRAIGALGKGRRARREEGDGRSKQGPSEETHIPNNVAEEPIVAIRPMRRADVDAFATWARHDDPLFRHYNVPALSRSDADEMWALLASDPAVRRPFAGLAGDRVVATLLVRNIDVPAATGELGIMLDPAYLGRGLGRRILRAFLAVLEEDGFRRVLLEVAGYNVRAIAAYHAAGFTVSGESWAQPEPGVDIPSLLEGPAAEAILENVRAEADGTYRARIVRMERRLTPQMKDDPIP
jgi:RimJ/RimL family protein N-acetyltransferase